MYAYLFSTTKVIIAMSHVGTHALWLQELQLAVSGVF
jgi:hypothetical protein